MVNRFAQEKHLQYRERDHKQLLGVDEAEFTMFDQPPPPPPFGYLLSSSSSGELDKWV